MSTDIEGSYTRVNYLLRPSKQVERKLIIEAIQRLSPLHYPCHKFRYVGLGSPYYADFIMFHKHLHISDMWCLEQRPIPKRMRLNKPYGFVRLFMKSVSEVLPKVITRRKHIVWLDYDEPLDDDKLSECDGFLSRVAPGSIVIVTVTAQLSHLERASDAEAFRRKGEELAGQYNQWFGRLLDRPIARNQLSRKELPKLFARVLRAQFVESARSRADRLEFLQLFNFRYADGAAMLTFGGVIDTPSNVERLAKTEAVQPPYAVSEEDPAEVSVPHLTRPEKHWLDQHLRATGGVPSNVAFEIPEKAVENYCRLYKYYPTYYEALL